MITETINQLIAHRNLSADEMENLIDEIMTGKLNTIELASLLTALACKQETFYEIAMAAKAMRKYARPFNVPQPVLEIVGTGGDHANTFNISTTTALIVAANGIPVAKHGNRAASSKSGSADVLEALNINIHLPTDASIAMLNEQHFCFLFAQDYHPAMHYVAPVRKELGIRTIFNLLGPLLNPAHAQYQLLGVYDKKLLLPMAKVLRELGVTDALVIHGNDGLDEATITTTTEIVELRNGIISQFSITPEDVGLKYSSSFDILGGDAQFNAKVTRNILAGEHSAKRDIVLLNAGLAIYIVKKNITIKEAINIATQTIDSGLALNKLQQLINFSQGVKKYDFR